MDGALLDDRPADSAGVGRIGPNAVIQLGHAVTDRLGRDAAERLYGAAGQLDLLREPPEGMVDEALPARLFAVLWQMHPDSASELAWDAGRRTADYVIARRIPLAARLVFAIAPRQIGTRLLLQAIARNAWTFAGSGQCETTIGECPSITITNNPLIMPGGLWHAAVLQRLFERLVASGTEVRHTSGSDRQTRHCRFDIVVPIR